MLLQFVNRNLDDPITFMRQTGSNLISVTRYFEESLPSLKFAEFCFKNKPEAEILMAHIFDCEVKVSLGFCLHFYI